MSVKRSAIFPVVFVCIIFSTIVAHAEDSISFQASSSFWYRGLSEIRDHLWPQWRWIRRSDCGERFRRYRLHSHKHHGFRWLKWVLYYCRRPL